MAICWESVFTDNQQESSIQVEILRDHTPCSHIKRDEDMVLRAFKEAKSEIPCQVIELPVLVVTLVTNSANNGEVFFGVPHSRAGW